MAERRNVAPPVDPAVHDGTCIVAIDFGTSRTAFSYTYAVADAEIVRGLPDNSVFNPAIDMKAETAIIIDMDDRCTVVGFGAKRKQQYLESTNPGWELFEWFK